MKATGIVRRIDELGRVVIPKEIRRTQRIRRGDPLEIFTTGGRGRDRRGGSVDRGPRRLPGGRPVQGRGSGGGLSGKADGGVRRDD